MMPAASVDGSSGHFTHGTSVCFDCNDQLAWPSTARLQPTVDVTALDRGLSTRLAGLLPSFEPSRFSETSRSKRPGFARKRSPTAAAALGVFLQEFTRR